MRHAKSGWDDPTSDDHSRPLSQRGIGAARKIGAWLFENGYLPDLVLSSTAERTRETWGNVKESLDVQPEVRFNKDLYLGSPDVMLNALRDVKTAGTVLLLGHNPGLGLAASGFAKVSPRHPQFERYPTAATTVLDFEVENWSELSWGSGEIVDFMVPRDLDA